MKLLTAVCMVLAATAASAGQDSPLVIPKKELPKRAACAVCGAKGNSHGEERPAAGVRYKGASYYFCDVKEVAEFKQDPDGFLPPVLPRPGPAFSLKNLAGDSVTLSSLRGKVVLVDFWATWCAPCISATMPEMQKLHEKYASKGLAVLGLSIDEEGDKKVRPFIAKRKFTYSILLDDQETWKAFGVKAVPALFLVDRDGKIVRQWTGKPSPKEVEAAINESLRS